MGGLFGGGGSKKHTGTAKETPAPTVAAPALAVNPDVVAADMQRRAAPAAPTIMTESLGTSSTRPASPETSYG